ncbi:hypothetical protein [Streptomyces sp. 5-10]|uniref:hypothetical protein n=1 Tax=Streptomyces sp. 5-10 TaxID=878925 RepID=UPI00168B4FF1|nr:hypothetical protein [Streptomyces sp. 5-10]MBD3004697.1 hypothetical protein [Streptomyces sp. 5-10]
MTRDEVLAHAYKLFESDMGLCACGQPWEGYELVRRLLDLAPYYEHPDRVTAAIGNDGSAHLVLSMLTRAELIEHGGAVGGSWLTPKGAWYRDALRLIDSWEEFDDGRFTAPSPHEGTPCGDACWNDPPGTDSLRISEIEKRKERP